MASHDDIDQLFRQIGGVPEGYREFGVAALHPVAVVAVQGAVTGSLTLQPTDRPSLSLADVLPLPAPAGASSIPVHATPLASLFDRLARGAGPSRAQGPH